MSTLPDDDRAVLPARYLEKRLDQWIDDFPIDAVKTQLEELERERGSIEAAIASFRRRLEIWGAMRAHAQGHGDKVPKPRKRDAVLNLLEQDPGRTFALSEIRDRLITDGLLEDSDKARHALDVTLSNMRRRGEVTRVRKGFYRLAPTGAQGSS